jgi:hypothetical protein
MLEIDAVRIVVHRQNLARYRRLLRTRLADGERASIERLMAEEQEQLAALARRSPRVASPPATVRGHIASGTFELKQAAAAPS